MLTKLLPDQVSKFWPIIKYAVEEALPPMVGDHPDRMNRILSAMLCGKLEVWASYAAENRKFEAVVVTQTLYDEASNTKSLLIYCLYGYSPMASESWIEGWEAIGKYAKSLKCQRIVAYSANPYVVENAKKLGCNTDYTFLSFDLNKIV